MNNKFKKIIHTAKETKLSEEKKASIRMRVGNFIEMTPVRSANPQPLRSRKYISSFSVLNFSKAISFALIVLIAGGSTMSYASEDALPGDTLYTVKVRFSEPIQETLALSQEAKLQVKTRQVERRLTEAQTLLEKNDTTPEKHAEVTGLVEKKVGEISKSIDKLQEKGDVETILRTTSKLQPVLKAHQEALKEISSEKAVESVIAVEATDDKPEDSIDQPEPDTEENITLEEVERTDSEEQEKEKQTKTSEENTEISEEETAEALEAKNVEDKAVIADGLLKKIEQTIADVEEKETKAIEQAETSEEKGSKIDEVTTKKFEEASKEINDAKENIEKETNHENAPEDADVDTSIDGSLVNLNDELKSDFRTLIVTEAEILLEESKILYEKEQYKESLMKAQQALKITEEMEASKRIDELRESIREIEEVTLEESFEEEIADSEEPETEEESKIETIPLQDQANKAIENLEEQLVSFNQ